MKLLVLFLVFYQLFLAQIYASSDGVACTLDAKRCPDGSRVGRTGPNCEFVCPGEKDGIVCAADVRQCPDGSRVGRTGPNCEFVCPGERAQIPKICTEEYAPVCGEIRLQCTKNSCNSTLKTFGNRCELESNPLAKYLYNGECLDKKTEAKIGSLWEKSISRLDENKKLKVVEKVSLKIEKLYEKIDGVNLKENVLSYIKYLALKTLGKN